MIYLTLIRMPVNWSAEEGMSMADGSMRPMRNYADKVFDRDARLAHMTDGRVDPILPLGAVLSTWQWGLVRRTPSTEQIGERSGTSAGGRGWAGSRNREAVRTEPLRFSMAFPWRNGPDDAGGLLRPPPGRDPDRRGSVRETRRRLGPQRTV